MDGCRAFVSGAGKLCSLKEAVQFPEKEGEMGSRMDHLSICPIPLDRTTGGRFPLRKKKKATNKRSPKAEVVDSVQLVLESSRIKPSGGPETSSWGPRARSTNVVNLCYGGFLFVEFTNKSTNSCGCPWFVFMDSQEPSV